MSAGTKPTGDAVLSHIVANIGGHSSAAAHEVGAFGVPSQSTGASSSAGTIRLDVIGEFELSRAFGATVTAYLGGIRASYLWPAHPRLSPFGEVLFGVEHCGLCQENSFATEFGFGARYALHGRTAIVGALTFRKVSESETETRFIGGISYAFR